MSGTWRCIECAPLYEQPAYSGPLEWLEDVRGLGVGHVEGGHVIELDWRKVGVDPETCEEIYEVVLCDNLTTGESYLEDEFWMEVPGSLLSYYVNLAKDGYVDYCYGYDWRQTGPAAYSSCYLDYGLRLTFREQDDGVTSRHFLEGYQACVYQVRPYLSTGSHAATVRFERISGPYPKPAPTQAPCPAPVTQSQ